MNVGNNKVMRCSRHVNVEQMGVRVNAEPLEDVDCLNLPTWGRK